MFSLILDNAATKNAPYWHFYIFKVCIIKEYYIISYFVIDCHLYDALARSPEWAKNKWIMIPKPHPEL